MKSVELPAWLHDVLGIRQSSAAIALIGVGALSAGGGLAVAAWPQLQRLPWFRSVPALILIFDIAAGAVANYSAGTNRFYATRPVNRWVFIAIHLHLPVVALLAGVETVPALAMWMWTIAGAFVVNAMNGREEQALVGGLVLVLGLTGTALLYTGPPWFMATSLLFLTKIAYGFAVDHFPESGDDEESA